MIEQKRYCADILMQTRAARSALKNLEVTILETHLSHCVSEAITSKNSRDANRKIAELSDLIKKF